MNSIYDSQVSEAYFLFPGYCQLFTICTIYLLLLLIIYRSLNFVHMWKKPIKAMLQRTLIIAVL